MTSGPGRAVVVVGSLHHDVMVDAPHRPAAGETVAGTAWHSKFGGKGGNQAVAAARAGAAVRMVGAVGGDVFAPPLMHGLVAAGVDATRVARMDAPTGMSVAIADPTGDYGAVIVSGANLLIDPAPLADPDLWANAAVLLLQNEVPEAVNRAAAVAAHGAGVPVWLNAAPVRPICPDLAVDLAVVNAGEAEWLGAGPVRDLRSAREAALGLARRFGAAVVTAGGHGAAWAEGTCAIAVPAPRVDVVSTHGAGDAFIGTLAAAVAAGMDRAASLDTAVARAAQHVAGR